MGERVIKGYDVWYVCPCGRRFRAPFGDSFHIHVSVCPDCGRSKGQWQRRTERLVSVGSWPHRRREWQAPHDNGGT